MNDGCSDQKSHELEGRTLEQHRRGAVHSAARRDRLQELHLQSNPAIHRGGFDLSGLLGLREY